MAKYIPSIWDMKLSNDKITLNTVLHEVVTTFQDFGKCFNLSGALQFLLYNYRLLVL
jgi:hypothetical protein